jgi:hypothetical protein
MVRSQSTQDALFLVASAIILMLIRLRYFYEPLDHDLPVRMAYAMQALTGAAFYKDLAVFGPPGALWINELFAGMFGANYLAIYVMGCFFSIASLLGIWAISRRLWDSKGAILAVVTWIVLCSDLFIEANQPNAETFINAALIWSLYFFVSATATSALKHGIFSGLLLFIASTSKHFILIIPAIAGIAHAVALVGRAHWTSRLALGTYLKLWSSAAVTVIACWLLFFAWYALTDREELLLKAVLGDSVRYAGDGNSFAVLWNLARGILPHNLLPPYIWPFLPLFAVTLWAAFLGLFKSRDARWTVLLGWCAGIYAAVAFPGKFFPHYYQYWLPMLAIGAGALYAYGRTLDFRASWASAVASKGTLVILGLLFVRLAYQYTSLSPVEAARAKYPIYDSIFAETRELGTRLKCFDTTRHVSVYELGAHGLYFYASALPPRPFIDSMYLGDWTDDYLTFLTAHLATEKPEFVVVKREILQRSPQDPFSRAYGVIKGTHEYAEVAALGSPNFMVLGHSTVAPRAAVGSANCTHLTSQAASDS